MKILIVLEFWVLCRFDSVRVCKEKSSEECVLYNLDNSNDGASELSATHCYDIARLHSDRS